MADVKNIITLGIGAAPGKLTWFITTGLEPAVVALPVVGDGEIIKASQRGEIKASPRNNIEAQHG